MVTVGFRVGALGHMVSVDLKSEVNYVGNQSGSQSIMSV